MIQQKNIEVTSHQLPLSCPPSKEGLWSEHPKVYLPIEKTGSATCPYCGNVFHMIDFQEFKRKSKGH